MSRLLALVSALTKSWLRSRSGLFFSTALTAAAWSAGARIPGTLDEVIQTVLAETHKILPEQDEVSKNW